MQVTYSAQRTGFEPGKAYANPRFFTQPRADASSVVVIGNWPAVVAAYEAIGVPVEVVDANPKPQPPPEPVSAPAVGQIPADWRDLSWSRPAQPGGPTLRGVVKRLGKTAVNAEQARAVIQEVIDGDA